MPTKLSHIGIAINNLPHLKKLFEILSLTISHTETVMEQGVKTHFIPLKTNSPSIELLEVLDPQGVVSKFIKKRGPGIHHLAFEVEQGQLDRLCSALLEAGYRLIYEKSKTGAHEMRINFIHPESAGGILIELMEKT